VVGDVQTAMFIAVVAALPASFLIGLLRHSEHMDRLRALEASRTRLVEVADAERRRIERDLHDGTQQQLLALLARVELVRTRIADEDAAIGRELRGISEGIRQVHRDLRELARGIHPAVLTDHGLSEAVRSSVARLPQPAEVDVSPDVEGSRYDPTIEAAAYFLVLEGVANAMKHAASSPARVRLSSHGDVLEVSISDTGDGLPADLADGTGSGLTGMRDRVAAVGGRLEIDSQPGAGTTLRAVLPVHRRVAS
jgi:signal transduction histidine kinase